MKMTPLILGCLCIGGLIAPLQAAPDVDSNAPLLPEDLGISKWVPKPIEKNTECLIVTVRVSKAGKEEFHFSRGVFDLKYAADCYLITYRNSPLAAPGLFKISFGKPGFGPGGGISVAPSGRMEVSEGTYMPDSKTFVRYLEYGDCRVDYMVEETSLEALKELAQHAELPNGERPGIAPLKEPRVIAPDPKSKKE
jgi:hypothetical protein